MLAATGRDSRSIDQLATLLAAADVLLSERPTDEDGARAVLDAIEIDRLEAGDLSDGELCLNHLLSATLQPELHVNGRRVTVGEAVSMVTTDGGEADIAKRALAAAGIAVRRANTGNGTPAQMAVAHRHTQLLRVFADTPWQGGGWKTSLLRLPGARIARDPQGKSRLMSFGGAKSRAVVLEGDQVPGVAGADA